MTQERKNELLDILLDWATEVISSSDLEDTLKSCFGMSDGEIEELGIEFDGTI